MCKESGLYDYWTKLELRRNNNNIDHDIQDNDHVTFISVAINLAQLFDLFIIYIRSIIISICVLIIELSIRFLKLYFNKIN